MTYNFSSYFICSNNFLKYMAKIYYELKIMC